MYKLACMAMEKSHNLSNLHNRNALSDSSGGGARNEGVNRAILSQQIS